MDFALDLIHGFLNRFADRVALSVLVHCMPICLIFECVHYFIRSMFSENVARKVVLITGASSGIGEHLAYAYARIGSYLVLAARRKNSLREVAEIARELGSPDVLPLYADVSKVEHCESLIEMAVQHFGQYHLVTCAGVAPVSLLEDLTDINGFSPAMDINFWGSAYVTYYAIPHLKRSKGKIVAIASSASWFNAPRLSFYNVKASKAAVVSFYETLRVEFGSDIGITIATPGLIESEMTKGKFPIEDGKLEVDQDIRDVLVSVLPVELVENCARAIVKSACRGDRYLVVPSWMSATFFARVFCPEVTEWLSRWLLIPEPGKPPTEALSKKLLDWSGIKEYIYPESIVP